MLVTIVPRRARKGFTLIETLMVVALLGILFALTSVQLRSSIEKEGPKGLAYTIVSELRSARAEAQRSGQMVGVCFASDAKTKSLCHSAYVRRGAQRGRVWKTLNFESEFQGLIFLGSWPTAVAENEQLPPGWIDSTRDEIAVVFRPDGSAVCNDLPHVDGRTPIVVGSLFAGNFSGPTGVVTGAVNPQTIWVSSSGSISITPNSVPVDTLPATGVASPIATLKPDITANSVPKIVKATLLPEMVDPVLGSGIGQTFLQLHPYQKDGDNVEYGLASLEVAATDDDGGPLSYSLLAEVVSGSSGKGSFSVPRQEGSMKFVRDPKTGQYIWRAIVSWRPPPGAPVGTVYNLKFLVQDPEGNVAEASSDTRLLPTMTSLLPARIVMETDIHQLYLTNLDGGGRVLTNPKEAETFPFFGKDGSMLYSFFDRVASADLRSRPADGTLVFEKLSTLTGGPDKAWIDPTNNFAMVLGGSSTLTFPWGDEIVSSSGGGGGSTATGGGSGGSTTYTLSTGSNSVPTQTVYIVNLATGAILAVPDIKPDSFFWAAGRAGVFGYTSVLPRPPVATVRFGPQIPPPGYQDNGEVREIAVNPMAAAPAPGPAASAAMLRYNPSDTDWYASGVGGRLSVGRHSTGQQIPVSSGPIEFVDKGSRRPSWSADGQHLSLIESPGAGAVVKSYRVFDDRGNPIIPPQKTFEMPVPYATRAQVDPKGEWVYYLKGGEVVRSVNGNPSPRTVLVSKPIGAPVIDYAISP
jgi:prepilin-type N-terminal cleavage/methylation domain-containing protein